MAFQYLFQIPIWLIPEQLTCTEIGTETYIHDQTESNLHVWLPLPVDVQLRALNWTEKVTNRPMKVL